MDDHNNIEASENKGSNVIFVSDSTYAWVAPSLIRETLEPHNAIKLIEQTLTSIYQIEVLEASNLSKFPIISVFRLQASCPFCTDGQNQILDSAHWTAILDWSEDKLATLFSNIDLTEEEEWLFQYGQYDFESKLNRYLFKGTAPFSYEFSDSATDQHVNAFGISLKQITDLHLDQMHISLSGISEHCLIIDSRQHFAGIYSCPYCSNRFGVFVSNARVQNQPSQKKAAEILECLARFQSEAKTKYLPSIHREPSKVTLILEDSSERHEIAFRTDIGVATIDGSSYFGAYESSDLFEILEDNKLSCHPIISSHTFDSGKIIHDVLRFLPALPQGVRCHQGEQGLRLLILANRFIGYPVPFYEFLETSSLFFSLIKQTSGLPRNYSELDRAFEYTGLPRKKEITQIVFNNPALLYAPLKYPNIPFENPDVILRLLETQRECDISTSENLWRFLSQNSWALKVLCEIKGEKAIFETIQTPINEAMYFDTKGIFHRFDTTDIFDSILNTAYWINSTNAKEAIRKARIEDLPETLLHLKWQADHPIESREKDYFYSHQNRALEGTALDFQFVLPKNPQELHFAEQQLHCCLASFNRHPPWHDNEIIILIKKDDDYVGEVFIPFGARIHAVLISYSRPISEDPVIEEAFHLWREEHNLE